MTLWNVGDKPTLKIHFALNGVGTDPTTVVLTIQQPDNGIITPGVVPDGSGDFHYDLTLTQSGIYRYSWVGTGAVVDTEQGEIVVVPTILGSQPPAAILASDIVTSALRIIQVTGKPGRSPSPEQMDEGVKVFNSMLDAEKANGFFAFATARTVFPLAAGVQDYTIGSTVSAPNFTIPRPPSIDYAGALWSGGTLETPMEVTTSAQRWREVLQKSQLGVPWLLYYEKTASVGTAHIWMKPQDASFQIALYTPENQERVMSLTTPMSLPPTYQECYEYNLALRLVGRYPNAKMSPEDRMIARTSRNAVIEMNHQPLARMSAFQNQRGGRTNISTGGGITW